MGRPLSLPDPFGSECPQYPGDAPPPPPAQPRAGGFPQSHLRTLHDDPYPLCWGVTPKPLGQPLLPVAWGQAMGLPYCCGAVPTLTFGDTPCPPQVWDRPQTLRDLLQPEGLCLHPPQIQHLYGIGGAVGFPPPPKVPSWLDSSTRKWGFTVPQTNTAGRGWRAALWSLLADIRVSFKPRCCARGTDGSGQVIKA